MIEEDKVIFAILVAWITLSSTMLIVFNFL